MTLLKQCVECGRKRCPDVTFYKQATEREKTLMRSGLTREDIQYLRQIGGFITSARVMLRTELARRKAENA